METSTYDPCLLIFDQTSNEFGYIGLQTDYTVGLSTRGFSDDEEEQLVRAKMRAKPKDELSTNKPLALNGGIVSMEGDSINFFQLPRGAERCQKSEHVVDSRIQPLVKNLYLE